MDFMTVLLTEFCITCISTHNLSCTSLFLTVITYDGIQWLRVWTNHWHLSTRSTRACVAVLHLLPAVSKDSGNFNRQKLHCMDAANFLSNKRLILASQIFGSFPARAAMRTEPHFSTNVLPVHKIGPDWPIHTFFSLTPPSLLPKMRITTGRLRTILCRSGEQKSIFNYLWAFCVTTSLDL